MARRIRLNRVLRQRLFNIIAKMPCPEEEQALQRAHRAATYIGDFYYARTVTVRDVDILTRWGLGTLQDWIPVKRRGATDGRWNYERWPLSTQKVVPVSNGSGPNEALIQSIPDQDAAWDVFQTYQGAYRAHQDALRALHEDYRKLVNGCVYLDEVEAIWPGARAIRDPAPEKPTTELTTLVPPDVLARIRRRESLE